jgi:hypothetical protein
MMTTGSPPSTREILGVAIATSRRHRSGARRGSGCDRRHRLHRLQEGVVLVADDALSVKFVPRRR